MSKLLNISEVSKLLELINFENKKPINHTLRYWETQFSQIKPTLINKRRYYTKDQIDLIRLIKFLLKDKGITIKGVKKILNNKINSLDDYNSYSLKNEYQKKKILEKSNIIIDKIKKIKNYGKKNTYKSKDGS